MNDTYKYVSIIGELMYHLILLEIQHTDILQRLVDIIPLIVLFIYLLFNLLERHNLMYRGVSRLHKIFRVQHISRCT